MNKPFSHKEPERISGKDPEVDVAEEVSTDVSIDATLAAAEDSSTVWMRHRFGLLLFGSIVITLVLTVISMTIYANSGAAQLDLSRPGYRSVSDKVDKTEKIDNFSATGSVNKDTINEFIKLYDAQAKKTKSVDAFNGDPLNPEVLEFGTTTE